jgi:hypothetical protein
MIEISIFQLWHLFNQEKGTPRGGFPPFWRWLKSCEFSYCMDAASGMLINVPEYVLAWGEDK